MRNAEYGSAVDISEKVWANFFAALSTSVPGAVDTLASDEYITKLYAEVDKARPPVAFMDPDGPVIFWWQISDATEGDEASLKDALLEWAKQLGIVHEQVLTRALTSLWWWNDNPKYRAYKEQRGFVSGERRWMFLPRYRVMQLTPSALTLTLSHTFDAESHNGLDKKAMKKEFFEACKATFEDYYATLLQERTNGDWQRMPKKEQEEHYIWLIRFQVQGLDYTQIADKHSEFTGEILGVDAIRKGIKRTADLLGITLRTA